MQIKGTRTHTHTVRGGGGIFFLFQWETIPNTNSRRKTWLVKDAALSAGGGRGPGGARFDRMLDIVSGGSRLRVDILIRRSGMRKTSRRMFFFLLWPMSSVLGPTTTTTTTEIEKKNGKTRPRLRSRYRRGPLTRRRIEPRTTWVEACSTSLATNHVITKRNGGGGGGVFFQDRR